MFRVLLLQSKTIHCYINAAARGCQKILVSSDSIFMMGKSEQLFFFDLAQPQPCNQTFKLLGNFPFLHFFRINS